MRKFFENTLLFLNSIYRFYPAQILGSSNYLKVHLGVFWGFSVTRSINQSSGQLLRRGRGHEVPFSPAPSPPMASSYPLPHCGGTAVFCRQSSRTETHLFLRFPSSLAAPPTSGGHRCRRGASYRRKVKMSPMRSFAADSTAGISGEEEEDDLEGSQMECSESPERWDVLGLGQAMVR